MINQPDLNRRPSSLCDVRYGIVYADKYHRPDDPELDESHIHGYYELYFNLSGDISFLVNNRVHPVQSGDMIFTRSGDVHICIYNKACVHEHYCMWIDCGERSPIAAFLEDAFAQNRYSYAGDGEQLTALLEGLYRAGDDEVRGTALLLQLLTFLADHKERGASTAAGVTVPTEMQRIVDYINESFADIHHVGDVLERFYVSQSTLTRWFRKYIHLSPKEFLEAKKLAYAKKLLDEGASVTDACMGAGFADCSHFIAVFKRRFGDTPFRYKSKDV